jgi:hypothetical protein
MAFGIALSITAFISSPEQIWAQTTSPPSMNNTNATKTNTQTTNATTAAPTNLTSTDTFSASGSISSIQLESLNASALMTTKSSPSTTTQTNVTTAGNASSLSAITNTTTASASQAAILPAKTFILSGFWHLNVNNGNISSFDVRFTKVHLDATNRHTHEITNLTLTDNKTSTKLNTNGTTTITGTTGVALNNIVVWKNVKTTITIINSSTIIISLDSKDTSNHFNGQSIYGTVDMVRDKNGNDIVHFPSIIHR